MDPKTLILVSKEASQTLIRIRLRQHEDVFSESKGVKTFECISGWWFGTMEFYDISYIGNVIIPTG
jgi:hypothetical protein